ncbi:MAG: hypothetical protein WA913_05640 [Pricia sp.]
MASIRDLKKDINNVLGDIIEGVYITDAANNKQDSKEGSAVVDEAITAFDELIAEVNKKDVDNQKKHFKKVRADLEKKAEELAEKVNALG